MLMLVKRDENDETLTIEIRNVRNEDYVFLAAKISEALDVIAAKHNREKIWRAIANSCNEHGMEKSAS